MVRDFSARAILRRDLGVVLLEFDEDLGEDVEAGGLLGADGDFAAGRAALLGDHEEEMAVAVEGVLGEGLEDAAGGGEGDFAAFAVEEALAYFAFEGLDLGGDGGLGDAQLLGSSGEALLVPDFKEGFELFEVHG